MEIHACIKGLEEGQFDEVLTALYGKEALDIQRIRYRNAVDKFQEYYPGCGEISIFSAPGRSEVCGNHTDHQHGCVLAAAINLDAIAVVSFHQDGVIRMQSEGYDPEIIDLSDLKISVKIIDKNKERCEELSEMLPNATIICGDGTDRALLMEEGLSTVESFVTLTNMDEENIFLSLSAKNMTQAKLIAKVNRLPYKDVIDELDIGSVIYPKYITSDSILRYVRAMQNTIGSNVETLYHVLDNQAEALEFIIRDNSPVVGIPLSKLNLKNNLLVCCLTREGTVRIPRGQDSIQIGDNVIIVTTHKGLRDIRDILA